MKNNKRLFGLKVFNGLKGFVFGFVLAVSLVAGAVYAWSAVWHGTDWIQAGKVVESEKIAENMEYLKQRVDNLENQYQSKTAPMESAFLPTNTEYNLSNDWNFIEIYGVSRTSAPIVGTITRLDNGQVKFLISSYTNSWDFIVSNIWQCTQHSIQARNTCIKIDNGDIYIKTGDANHLIFNKY